MKSLLLHFVILHVVHGSCRAGFELVRDGECRGLYAKMTTVHDEGSKNAVAKCQEIQSFPVIIRSEEDQLYWRNQTGTWTWIVIGLMCNTQTRQWQWADGSPLSYKPPSGGDDFNLYEECTTATSWYLQGEGSWSGGPWVGNVTTDVFCTAKLQQPVRSADGCESFEDDSDDGVCYQIGATAENWQEGQLICKSFGGTLASIHNQKENSFIRRLAVSKGEVKGVYLGGTVSGKGDQFGWIDGTDWDFDNFNPGFPVKGYGDCLAMDTEGTSGQWVNVDCSSQLSLACMRQQNYSTPSCTSGPWQEGQIISSPGFPFDASTPCDFILLVDAGKRVEMEVLMLEANNCCDHLILFDNYIAGNVMANLTGEVNATVYTSPSNSMRVSWQPNGGTNVRGMMITFKGI